MTSMMMMTLGGAVCPVRNETDNTCYKNVAAPKRALSVLTETESPINSQSADAFGESPFRCAQARPDLHVSGNQGIH